MDCALDHLTASNLSNQLLRIFLLPHPNLVLNFVCGIVDPDVFNPLLRCKQPAIFFNVLFNLTKFIQGDQKDPAQIFHERATPELTDWDRYAKLEYSRSHPNSLNQSCMMFGRRVASWNDIFAWP